MSIVCLGFASGELKLVDVGTLEVLKTLPVPGLVRVGTDNEGGILAIINNGATSRLFAKDTFEYRDTTLTANCNSSNSYVANNIVYSTLGYYVLGTYNGNAVHTISRTTGQIVGTKATPTPQGGCLFDPSTYFSAFTYQNNDQLMRINISPNGQLSDPERPSGTASDRINNACKTTVGSYIFASSDFQTNSRVLRGTWTGHDFPSNPAIIFPSGDGLHGICPDASAGAYATEYQGSIVWHVADNLSYNRIDVGFARAGVLTEDGLGGCVTGWHGANNDGVVTFIDKNYTKRTAALGALRSSCLYHGEISTATLSSNQIIIGGV